MSPTTDVLRSTAAALQAAAAVLAEKKAQYAARAAEVTQHEAAIADVAGTLARLDEQQEVTKDDLLDAENLRRRLTRLEMERGLALEALALARGEETAAQLAADTAERDALLPEIKADRSGLLTWAQQLSDAARIRGAAYAAKVARADALASKIGGPRPPCYPAFRADTDPLETLGEELKRERSDAASAARWAQIDRERAARDRDDAARAKHPGGSYPGTYRSGEPGILGFDPAPAPANTYEPLDV